MFGFFKKTAPSPSANGPHPHHRNFARLFVPDALTRHRSGFLAAMSDPRANQTLHESWQKFGAGVLPAKELRSPAGLEVSAFRHGQHLCFLIQFPTPQAPGEAYFGFIVAGPADDWSPAVRATVPVRYFLLEQTANPPPVILEWRSTNSPSEEVFDARGPGPATQHPPDFVATVLTQFIGLKLDV